MNERDTEKLVRDWEEEFHEPIPKDPFQAIRRCLDRLEEDRYAEDEKI